MLVALTIVMYHGAFRSGSGEFRNGQARGRTAVSFIVLLRCTTPRLFLFQSHRPKGEENILQ